MSFNVADIITGEDLLSDAPLVAILLSMTGGNKRRRTHTAIRPATHFPVESLPIRGTYYDWGEFNVADESQLSVALALQMTGCSTWQQFRNENSEGLTIGGKDDIQFGYALMHASTYDALLALGSTQRMRTTQELAEAREAVKSAWIAFFRACTDIVAQFSQSDDQQSRGRNYITEMYLNRALSLADWGDLEHLKLPNGQAVPACAEFMRIQGSGAEFAIEGPFLKDLLQRRGYLGDDVLAKYAELGEAWLPEVLEQVVLRWELNEVQTAMQALGKSFAPSVYRAEGGNATVMLAWQTEMLKQTFAREARCVEESYMVDAYYEELSAQGKQLEELGQHVQAVAKSSAPRKVD